MLFFNLNKSTGYSIDEITPDRFTPKYTQPIEVPDGNKVTLKIVTYRNNKPVGRVIAFPREELVKRVRREKKNIPKLTINANIGLKYRTKGL